MTIAQKIRDRRVALGMTQQELAGRANLSTTTVGRCESGSGENVKYETLQAVASALRCPVRDLLPDTSTRTYPGARSAKTLRTQLQDVARAMLRMNESGRRATLTFVGGIASNPRYQDPKQVPITTEELETMMNLIYDDVCEPHEES